MHRLLIQARLCCVSEIESSDKRVREANEASEEGHVSAPFCAGS